MLLVVVVHSWYFIEHGSFFINKVSLQHSMPYNAIRRRPALSSLIVIAGLVYFGICIGKLIASIIFTSLSGKTYPAIITI